MSTSTSATAAGSVTFAAGDFLTVTLSSDRRRPRDHHVAVR